MILAGIDEAGYGPLLGPLVVGCCAVELPVDAAAADESASDALAAGDGVPCGWRVLRRLVGRSRDAKGKRLHVNDSKKVYAPAVGLTELERGVLCLAATRFGGAGSLDAFLGHVSPESRAALAEVAWYAARADEPWPHANDALDLSLRTNHARHELARAGVRVAHLHAYVTPEPQLNALFDATGNKAAASFTFVARHLDALLADHADAANRLTIFCDRQGGRSHYGEPLRALLGHEWDLTIVGESPARSEYRLVRGDRAARLIFAEQAEQQCISVALASMLSKYLRETTMARFNAYWRAHLPELKPTAGYHTDGQRFLADIHDKCVELDIDPTVLIRQR